MFLFTLHKPVVDMTVLRSVDCCAVLVHQMHSARLVLICKLRANFVFHSISFIIILFFKQITEINYFLLSIKFVHFFSLSSSDLLGLIASFFLSKARIVPRSYWNWSSIVCLPRIRVFHCICIRFRFSNNLIFLTYHLHEKPCMMVSGPTSDQRN